MNAAEFRAKLGLPPPGESAQPKKAQISLPDLSGPNKTESSYLRILQSEFPGHEIKYEAISFRLHAGTLYTVDFSVWKENALILAVECKGGFVHKGASLEKFKQARAEWPHIKFRFAQQRSRNEWSQIQ